jgi:hypothetical protein
MRTRRVICPLFSQKVTLLARNGSFAAGCRLPSASKALKPSYLQGKVVGFRRSFPLYGRPTTTVWIAVAGVDGTPLDGCYEILRSLGR